MTIVPPSHAELHELIAALCEGTIRSDDFARLQAALARDVEAQRFYVRYLDIHAALRRLNVEGEADRGECGVEKTRSPSVSASDPPVASPPAGRFPISSVALALSLVGAAGAVAIVVAMGGFGWFGKVGEPSPSARQAATVPDKTAPAIVARITGTTNCHEVGTASAVREQAPVPLGSQYVLAAGFMEITYRSGAKVILQAPCRYQVDSANGGFLALGKLTAKLDAQPATFVVRTPTATVTNLGAECGVEADASGASQTHVFAGEVKVLLIGGDTPADNRTICLRKNEAARVETAAQRIGSVSLDAAQPGEFMHQLPLPMHLSNTGVGLKDGDPDPHWQIVARSDQPNFKPHPAVVVPVTGTMLLQNAPTVSQWISVPGDLASLPDNVTYTFRTTFELSKLGPGPRELRALFLAENGVTSVRLNGVPVTPPNLSVPTTPRQRHEFVVRSGFVEGRNVLEIDVNKYSPARRQFGFRPNRMMLRVEFEGFYIGAAGTLAAIGKEGAAMN
jgi:hypothetical protein